MAKVLLVTVSQSIRHIAPKVWTAIHKMDRGRHVLDYLVVTEQKPRTDPNRLIMNNLEKARHYAIQLGYHCMFIVENDVIVPEHALTHLLNLASDVAVGLYPERPSKVGTDDFLVCIPWNKNKNARRHIEKGEPFILTGRGGYGCVLIRHRVFSKVKFPAGDMSWYDILHAEGFKVMCNPHVICFHINHTAKGKPVIRGPNYTVKYWKKVIAANKKRGSTWFHGLPYMWWWGMNEKKFLQALPSHLDRTSVAEERWYLVTDPLARKSRRLTRRPLNG